MPLRKLLARLVEALSQKEADAVKQQMAAFLTTEAVVGRPPSRDLQTGIAQLLDAWLAKRLEPVLDVIASAAEPTAVEVLRQVNDRLLSAQREARADAVAATLELLLRVVSRGPWWNQMVLAVTQPALVELARDATLPVDCAVSLAYTLAIVVPYSVASLDERHSVFLCATATQLLSRSGGGDALAPAAMQLVLILYGVIPVTFVRQLVATCPPPLVDAVVAQLRLHPVLLAQTLGSSSSNNNAVVATNTSSAPTAAFISNSASQVAAECRSKQRFRGKEASDIVTECLNYEATSPPKLFSIDAPRIELQQERQQPAGATATASLLPKQNLTATTLGQNGEHVAAAFDSDNHSKQTRAIAITAAAVKPMVDWCHSGEYFSLPASPGAASIVLTCSSQQHQQQKERENSNHHLKNDNQSTATTNTGSQNQHQPERGGQQRTSLATLNEQIRARLAEQRKIDGAEANGENVPAQFLRAYSRLAQLREPSSLGGNETDLMREQLRLAQLALAFERHRQLIFINKNRALMTQLVEKGHVEGLVEELQRRLVDAEQRLEQEMIRARQHPLSVSIADGAPSLALADLSPRYRVSASNNSHQSGRVAGGLQPPALGSAPDVSGVGSDSTATVMPRTHSSGEFFQHSSEPGMLATHSNSAKREFVELQKERDDLQQELGVLRQQLRQVQLEALASVQQQQQQQQEIDSEPKSDDAAERIELLTQQLNDSRREVAAMQEVMHEMKSRLDQAEADRRRLAADLVRVATQTRLAPSYVGALARQLSSGGESHTMMSSLSSIAANMPSNIVNHNSQRLEQYPTLKRQVEKILLKKQEIAVFKD